MARRRTQKKALPPRRKRMKREARLQSASHWIPTYAGKNLLVRGYARWFGVDLLCAVKELRMLGVEVSADYEAKLRATMQARQSRRWPAPQAEQEPWPLECDEFHAFIAGYTSGGFSYGITWEEWERMEAAERGQATDRCR